ncbi:MAG: RdgB/HAM1 family non-canonical purine NTP pyrophosphatase [Candidatus Omnitrophica bacterium]|nr:RdgB/HAM1 family non-canonical purine NTP pyrophosphatase [Candidatus Omnitrophota bacterium]
MRLIVATSNRGKLREIKRILRGSGVSIISLADLDKKFNLKENGKTFLENAIKKTSPVSKFYKDDFVVGEDSGLEVNYLNGAPGVHSKRYSGSKATSITNNKKLLKALNCIKKRGARFCCALVLMKNAKVIKTFSGVLSGAIATHSQGSGGFGYDPIFYLSKYKKTTAQLSSTQKNAISHRGKAFFKLKTYFGTVTKYNSP